MAKLKCPQCGSTNVQDVTTQGDEVNTVMCSGVDGCDWQGPRSAALAAAAKD